MQGKNRNACNLLPKLADKISHSEALLHSCDNSARISGKVVLLFPNKNFELNIRELRRRCNGKNIFSIFAPVCVSEN